MENRKKYIKMENVLHNVNRDFISFEEPINKRNKVILTHVLNEFKSKITQMDRLFNKLYTEVFYGGSYYDGLRVKHPNEFDLDLILHFPNGAGSVLYEREDYPGYARLALTTLHNLNNYPDYRDIHKLLDDNNNVLSYKVRRWMEGLVTKAVTALDGVIYSDHGTFKISFKKSGPAITLTVYNPDYSIQIDVDLVPCISVNMVCLPRGIKVNTINNVFLVPKPFKGDEELLLGDLWRLSFQKQEAELLNGQRTLKPAIKLLKKMRDTLDHVTIASYYIKTVGLWLREELIWDPDYATATLSQMFMTLLKKYLQFLEEHSIPFYWNENNNLVGHLSLYTRINITNRIKRIIADIDRNIDDPNVILKYLLTENELQKYKFKYQITYQGVDNMYVHNENSYEQNNSSCIIL